ncbi:hypothetical protein LWI28_024931 [Acer negundo]|uniref:B box-type domain-containing protein n=1 Tax=Acer negundo TaxID=4023 RepID=A0AAD5NVM6_ACENE|nr:hypothetical protein LWI28_024931 [Acer negundo]KAK4836660.1 hypothetical protein QYF36_025855 [Acer negundo]
MRTLCDVCESAAAIVFCAADEASLCRSCDEKVHMCNKLASRHVRVGLASPSDVPRCDICESAPAFFYCEIDGSSLCLQCDMTVHVGGKRTHGRYLLLRQRVEFPGDKPGRLDELALQTIDPNKVRREQTQPLKITTRENQQNQRVSPLSKMDTNADGDGKVNSKSIDLNARPQHGPGLSNQGQESLKNEQDVPGGNPSTLKCLDEINGAKACLEITTRQFPLVRICCLFTIPCAKFLTRVPNVMRVNIPLIL